MSLQIPEIHQRRFVFNKFPESDTAFVLRNLEAAVWLLENVESLKEEARDSNSSFRAGDRIERKSDGAIGTVLNFNLPGKKDAEYLFVRWQAKHGRTFDGVTWPEFIRKLT